MRGRWGVLRKITRAPEFPRVFPRLFGRVRTNSPRLGTHCPPMAHKHFLNQQTFGGDSYGLLKMLPKVVMRDEKRQPTILTRLPQSKKSMAFPAGIRLP